MTIDKNILSTTEAPQSSQPAMSKKKQQNPYTKLYRIWIKVWAKVRVRDTVRDRFLEETRTT